MQFKEKNNRLSRRDFLKLFGVVIATEAFNSMLGQQWDSMVPTIEKPNHCLSQYDLAWQAKPWVWINLAIASERINNTIIKPGTTISLNDLLGFKEMQNVSRQNTDPAIGYIAAQMSNPLELSGWGYGLCLASTTIFRAALQSPLSILQRRTHYDIYSDYFSRDFPVGTDAAVYYPDTIDGIPEADLILRNNTDNPINMVYKVVDSSGKILKPPDAEVSDATYKASYLYHLIQILRKKIPKLPKQYVPEFTFENQKIVSSCAFVGPDIPYTVSISPVKKHDSGSPYYFFNRKVTIKNTDGTKSEYREDHVSNYKQ